MANDSIDENYQETEFLDTEEQYGLDNYDNYYDDEECYNDEYDEKNNDEDGEVVSTPMLTIVPLNPSTNTERSQDLTTHENENLEGIYPEFIDVNNRPTSDYNIGDGDDDDSVGVFPASSVVPLKKKREVKQNVDVPSKKNKRIPKKTTSTKYKGIGNQNMEYPDPNLYTEDQLDDEDELNNFGDGDVIDEDKNDEHEKPVVQSKGKRAGNKQVGLPPKKSKIIPKQFSPKKYKEKRFNFSNVKKQNSNQPSTSSAVSTSAVTQQNAATLSHRPSVGPSNRALGPIPSTSSSAPVPKVLNANIRVPPGGPSTSAAWNPKPLRTNSSVGNRPKTGPPGPESSISPIPSTSSSAPVPKVLNANIRVPPGGPSTSAAWDPKPLRTNSSVDNRPKTGPPGPEPSISNRVQAIQRQLRDHGGKFAAIQKALEVIQGTLNRILGVTRLERSIQWPVQSRAQFDALEEGLKKSQDFQRHFERKMVAINSADMKKFIAIHIRNIFGDVEGRFTWSGRFDTSEKVMNLFIVKSITAATQKKFPAALQEHIEDIIKRKLRYLNDTRTSHQKSAVFPEDDLESESDS